MNPHPAQPHEAPALAAESPAAAWIGAGLAVVMTVASLLAAALV
jgi:hypothetical protein